MFFQKRYNTVKLIEQMRTSDWAHNMDFLIRDVIYDAQQDKNGGETWERAVKTIDFYIDALGREIVAYYAYSKTAEHDVPNSSVVEIPSEFVNYTAKGQWICKEDLNVVSFPWKLSRVKRALCDIAEEGYCHQETADTCRGLYYPELNFCVLHNGHHHAAAAQYLGCQNQLRIEVNTVNMTEVFKKLCVDERFNWRRPDGSLIEQNSDPRFVAIYRLAKCKAELFKQI